MGCYTYKDQRGNWTYMLYGDRGSWHVMQCSHACKTQKEMLSLSPDHFAELKEFRTLDEAYWFVQQIKIHGLEE